MMIPLTTAATAATSTATSASSMRIHRVVSCFLLTGGATRETAKVAVFLRQASMPTFPSHWAPCSGSVEVSETPLQTARRELLEETNLGELLVVAQQQQQQEQQQLTENKQSSYLFRDNNEATTTKTTKTLSEVSLVDFLTEPPKDLSSLQLQSLPSYGLYVDVPHPKRPLETVIRVYPFAVRLPPNNQQLYRYNNDNHTQTCRTTTVDATVDDEWYRWSRVLELRGTEHDRFQFVSVAELEQLQPTVPALAQAFHHATFGTYLETTTKTTTTTTANNEQEGRVKQQQSWSVPWSVREWANDHVNGAAVLAQRALQLLKQQETQQQQQLLAQQMMMMRPTMVAITNVLRPYAPPVSATTTDDARPKLDTFEREAQRAVDLAVEYLRPLLFSSYGALEKNKNDATSLPPLRIATFSRSSTLVKVLRRLQSIQQHEQQNKQQQGPLRRTLEIECSKSTPGDEGLWMARDLEEQNNNNTTIVCRVDDDDDMEQALGKGHFDVLLVGADCVMMQDFVINKVGTARMARAAARSNNNNNNNNNTTKTTRVICCTDRFKVWDHDCFPPPMEPIFELVPRDLFDTVLVPPPSTTTTTIPNESV